MANYLWKSRHGTYYFRVRIPPKYRYYFNHNAELRRSLNTTNRANAKRHARAMMAALETQWERLDTMSKDRPAPTTRSYWTINITREQQASGDFKLSKTLNMTPEEHQQLGDEAVNAIVAGMNDSEAHPVPAPAPPKSTCPKLSEVLEDYITNQNWDTPITEVQYRGSVAIIIALCGDKPFNLVNKADARKFKDALALLPPNMNHAASPYRGMTVDQIIAAKPLNTLSPTTIKHHITRAKALFNWIDANYDELHNNPFSGIKAPSVDKSKGRDPISNEDVAKIFSCYLYSSDEWPRKKKGKEPSKFWIPLIVAFTGCRLNEASQLYVEDIQKDEGVWVVYFNDSRKDQILKGAFSRKVPLHKSLINAGLPDFADQQRRAGHDRLFPELDFSNSGQGYSQAIGEFCRGLFKSLGVKGTPHAFRHSVIQALTQADVELRKAQYLVGHKGNQSVTEEVYGANKFTVRQLRSAINKLDYSFAVDNISFAMFRTRTTVQSAHRR